MTAITGYLGDPQSLPAAFEGVERIYLAPLPETLGITMELATQARVQYLAGQIKATETVREPYPTAVEAATRPLRAVRT